MLYGFDKNLEDSRKELIRLKDAYGYDNVKEIEIFFNMNDRDYIIIHLDMPVENLKNALEHYLDREDYRGAEIVTKLLELHENKLDEITILNIKVIRNKKEGDQK